MADENTAQTLESAATEVKSEVDAALEKDPQRQLAKRIEENLKDAGVEEPKAEGEQKPEDDKEFLEAKTRVANALKERNKVFKERESARAEAEAIKHEAQKAKAELDAQMQNFRQQMQGFQRWQADLRQDPARALKAIGIDPEEFILGIAQAGTPESRLAQQLKAQEEKLNEFEKWKLAQAEELQKKQQEQQRAQAQEFRSKVETDFMSMASSDKYTNVKRALEIGLISKKALINDADDLADQYREATKGEEASLEELLEYIDTQFASAIGKLSGTSQVKRSTEEGKPSQGASGKTLSQDDAGERRALSRDLRSADSDERREAAKKAVGAVLKKLAPNES